jgi:hypothetical protein
MNISSMSEQLVDVKTETATKHVDEVDVLRGQEVIKRHTGKNGAFCFVVRRPGKRLVSIA